MSNQKESTYSQGYHPTITANHRQRRVEVEGAFVLPHLKSTDKILDVGCGPGTITVGFAKRVSQGSVTGVDLSQSVLDQALAFNSESESPATNVIFEIGNVVEGLKYADDTFDIVFCSQTLLHISEPVKALKEMRRVCKPGGFIAARESDFPFRWYPYLPGLQLADKYIYEQIMGATSLPHPQSPPLQPNARCGSSVHVWAREAGFDPAKMKKGVGADVMASEEERKSWAGMWLGRIDQGGMKDTWRKLGATEEEFDLVRRDIKAWETDVDGWHAILQAEVICWK
jgi:SAM-dependent methyltransferase